jgi:superfamily I DNA/RNA helicase
MKGLEARVVFVFNVVEGVLPHLFSMKNESEIEEELRLFYVAVTRARDICYITLADQVYLGRNLVDAEPSRFLAEIGIEVH